MALNSQLAFGGMTDTVESSQKVSSKRRPTDFGGLTGFKNNTVGEGLAGDSTTTVATGAALLHGGKRSGGASSPKRSHHCGDNNGGQQRARNNSSPAMDRDHRHHRATNGFILGDDDSDDDDMLDSASDASSDGGVGEVNTAMSFVLDEDSGLGFSTSPSGDDESAERFEQPAELVPLRPMVVGGSFASRGPRKTKLHFDDFYRMGNDHLGSGAYASVRTATSISTGKEYAVKLVGKHEPGHTRSRILREVDTFKMCKNHPNIVQLIEWFEDENYFYMVFEKVRGGPLLNHIQRKVCFTEQEATQVTKDIATALKYLHDRGIAHRDIKPENILCVDPDRVSPVKICDLDLASKPHVTPKSSRPLPTVHSEPDLASPVGSAEFMAPEVVDAFVGDALKYDKRCDMWSLGVIIYIMLCGYPPFYGECERENCGWDQGDQCTDCQESLFHRIQRGDFDFPEEEWANISREAKDLISHLLVKNVRQRYTADDVLKHPWVVHGAPKTPLLTANNLFRNDSARDMHQMQEHFNVMNRFNVTRLSTRLETSNGASPEESAPTSPTTEQPPVIAISLRPMSENIEIAPKTEGMKQETIQERVQNEPLHDVQMQHDIVMAGGAPQHEMPPVFGQQQPQYLVPQYEPHQQYYPMPPPQMINMNGMIICAPPMAPNPMMKCPPPMAMPQQPLDGQMYAQPPMYYGRVSHGNMVYANQNCFYQPTAELPPQHFVAEGVPPFYPQQQHQLPQFYAADGRVPPLQLRPSMRKSESGGNWRDVSAAARHGVRAQRSLTPGFYARQYQQRQAHAGKMEPQRPFTAGPLVYNVAPPTHPSLSSAMSQMGLETCQNAMSRQDSTDKLLRQHQRPVNNETRVNV